MKKIQSILLTLGIIVLISGSSEVYGQGWGEMSTVPAWQDPWQSYQVSNVSNEMPQFPPQTMPVPPPPQQQAIPYYPAPNYTTDRSLGELTREVEDLKRELAKKSDKPDPSKGFTTPKISGRVFMDSVNIVDQDDDGSSFRGHNSFGFREARLGAAGTAYDFLDYKFEIGFETNNGANFKDVFLGIKYVPLLGYVRVGNHFVEDAGSEISNSPTNYTFMETPAPAGDLFTSRRLGISSRHLFARDRVRLHLGTYGAKNVSGTHQWIDSNQGFLLNARLTHALMFQREGKNIFLYGGYYSFTDPSDANQRYARVRPGGWDLDMGYFSSDISADHIQKAGFETVYQNGAFCLQTDLFMRHFSNAANSGDATMYGGFLMGRYFLTQGDYRKYSLENASWGSVTANRPFLLFQRGSSNFIQGPGAWEIASYYGFLNTDDFKNTGVTYYGTDHQIGAALNWYWNPQLKWTLNYIHQMADITSGVDSYKPSVDVVALSCRFHW